MAKTYRCNGLTGGSGGSLDSIDGAVLSSGDMALTIDSNTLYCHELNSSSGASESSPDVISPDTNAINKRWELTAVYFNISSYSSAAIFDAADEILISQSGANKSGTLTQLNTFINGNTSHKSRHITSGFDEIDGDKIDIDWNPSYYTPATVTDYSDSVDNLTSHLKGIDTKLNFTNISFDGNVNLVTTTSSSLGIIKKGSDTFLHDFHHPTGSTAIPNGHNIFLGISAGNLTMGSTATTTIQASYNLGIGSNALKSVTTGRENIGIGHDALTALTSGYGNTGVGRYTLKALTTGFYNVTVGISSLAKTTTGYSNVAIGYAALYNNTSGCENVAIGLTSLFENISGDFNVGVGHEALYSATTADRNVAVGYCTLNKNITGYDNAAIGSYALYNITTGYTNVGFGYNAGRYISGGSSPNTGSFYSVYLGAETKAYANGDSNEIVIGYSTTGFGSNTAAYGNNNILKHIFQTGNIGIKNTNPNEEITIGPKVATPSSTPDCISIGGTFADSAGSGVKAKLKLFDDESVYCGLSISDGQQEYIVPTGVKHAFYIDTVKIVEFTSSAVNINGYTQLGTASPKIAMKKLTGTTSAVEGEQTAIAHGLTSSKIISVSAIVLYSSGAGVLPVYTTSPGYQFNVYFDSSNVGIYLSESNSENILSKDFIITIFYEE